METKEQLIQRFTTAKERVEWLLINKPTTRGDGANMEEL